MELSIYLTLFSALFGGIIARIKNDYFTRGFFICLITSIFGLVAIILSSPSKAREGNQEDYHGWPKYGSYAVLFLLFWFLLILTISIFL